MDRLDRLSCEVAVWAEVAMAFGLEALRSQRSTDLWIPDASELATRAGLRPRSVLSAYEMLRLRGIISERQRHRRGYILKKPLAFSREVSRRLGRRVGAIAAFSLPPYLRSKSREELIAAISAALAPSGMSALAALHSAFLVSEEPIKSARIYSGPGPLCLVLEPEALKVLVEALSLARLAKEPSSVSSRPYQLALPRGSASADVLLFKKSASLAMPGEDYAAASDYQAVRPLHPYLNALMLSLYPLRGEEASERLLELLRSLPRAGDVSENNAEKEGDFDER